MNVLSATIRYKDVSFIKIYDSALDGSKVVNVIYRRADEDQEERIAPFESLYFRVYPQHLSKKFGKETIGSHWETDFYYDDEGASDELSKKELDELISYCELMDNFDEVKEGLIERSWQITTNFHMDESTEDEFRMYYRQFLNGYSYDEIIRQAYDDAYADEIFINNT
jgi:hypothetical protein